MTTTLIAADTPAVRTLLSTLLRGEGHNVTTTFDGHRAAHLLRRGTYDLAVLGSRLPGPTGLEIMSECRARDVQTRFVIWSPPAPAPLPEATGPTVPQSSDSIDSAAFLTLVRGLLAHA